MKNFPTEGTQSDLKLRIVDHEDLSCIYSQAILIHRSAANTSPVMVDDRRNWYELHEPQMHPIFVAGLDGYVISWCSLSVYRPGRAALRFTAEISYYVDNEHQHQGGGGN